MSEIRKTLTANDVGATGSHQAGMAIPKHPEILEFFPHLDTTQHNPRASLNISVPSLSEEHTANFIYYNGRTLGLSTRNEYRLTGLTAIFRALGAQAGDVVHLAHGSTDVEIVLSIGRSSENNVFDSGPRPIADESVGPVEPPSRDTIAIKGWTVNRKDYTRK